MIYRRHVRARLRLYARRARAFVFHRVLHADDPPHALALGAAIGVFVTFTPMIGLQMAANVFLAWLFRANKVIGLPIVWISNPATFIPIYYPCYVIGRTMLYWEPVSEQWWQEIANPPPTWWPSVAFYWSRLMEIAIPLWLGCTVVGVILAYPTYYLVFYSISSYRLRHGRQPRQSAGTSPTPAEATASVSTSDESSEC